jgi:soluble lytic murein transglycosylase-like protein
MKVVFVALVAAMAVVNEPVTVDDIDAAIRWLTRDAPRSNPMQTDSALRRETAAAFLNAAQDTNIDPYLLLVIARRESSFRPGASGKLGEVGVMQIHGPPLRRCERDGFDMRIPYDQVMCSARYLREMIDQCGSVTRGLTAYASGSCIARTDKTSRLVAHRLRMAQRLSLKPWEQ